MRIPSIATVILYGHLRIPIVNDEREHVGANSTHFRCPRCRTHPTHIAFVPTIGRFIGLEFSSA
jgi:hypothetical protein